MAVEKGDTVSVEYEGTLDDGSIFDSTAHGDHTHPLEFEAGSGMVIKGFDEAVMGMNVGDEKDIVLPPEEAYGPYNEQLHRKVPRQALDSVENPEEGMILVLGLPNGQQAPVKILEIGDEEVTLDMNHPMAGKTLHFHIKLVNVKKPKEE